MTSMSCEPLGARCNTSLPELVGGPYPFLAGACVQSWPDVNFRGMRRQFLSASMGSSGLPPSRCPKVKDFWSHVLSWGQRGKTALGLVSPGRQGETLTCSPSWRPMFWEHWNRGTCPTICAVSPCLWPGSDHGRNSCVAGCRDYCLPNRSSAWSENFKFSAQS